MGKRETSVSIRPAGNETQSIKVKRKKKERATAEDQRSGEIPG